MANQEYVLGRGKVNFARFTDGTTTQADGFRYLGNTPSFSTTTASDTLDHYSADAGLKVKDKSVTLQVNRTGSFTCDNITGDNLALVVNGTVGSVIGTSGTALTETKSLFKSRSYQIGVTANNPSGLRKLTNFVLKTTGGSPATVAMTGNYTIDLTRGILTILDSPLAITDGTSYTLQYDTLANTREQIVSKNLTIYGAIQFLADNAVGKNRDYLLPYVKLSPNGDYSLKGDEWQVMTFDLEILKLDDNTEAMYIDGQPV